MRIIFHAGLHKTATSAFQKLCLENRGILASRGIYFSELFDQGNGYAAIYETFQGKYQRFSEFVKAAVRSAKAQSCEYILFSAEDLENVLLDHQLAVSLEGICKAHGINTCVWFFVIREEYEYFESLYSQLARDSQVIDYKVMGSFILANGHYSCLIPRFRWYFAFDYFVYFSSFFNRGFSGGVVHYDDFVDDFPGAVLFRSVLEADQFVEFRRNLISRDVQLNKRDSREITEARYVARFLGLRPEELVDFDTNKVLSPLVSRRVQMRSTLGPFFERRFKDRFGSSECLLNDDSGKKWPTDIVKLV